MGTTFPFGLPGPTAVYLVLYLATFALHQAFIHYVVAGSLYIAWATLVPGRANVSRADQPLASILRDWLPFVLSAAITAGVAPLLFIQIVYPRHFYTANLLLSWRWMIVVPVLVVAFYLLYLIKSSTLRQWPYAARSAVALLVAALLLFVGFCWTANHLIANCESNWPQVYASGRVSLSGADVLLRMLIWVGGAFASMAVIAVSQLAVVATPANTQLIAAETRRLCWTALGGLALASAAAMMYLARVGEDVRALLISAMARPYLIAAAVGVAVQLTGWVMQLRQGSNRWLLRATSFAWLLTLLSSSFVREAIRLASVDISALYSRHADARGIGGITVFITFTVLNTTLIAACIWFVRRGLTRATNENAAD